MPKYKYAEGRIAESVSFVLAEMDEFDRDYAKCSWNDYSNDGKLQKLTERTVENILTALIEVAGTCLARNGIAADNYAEVMEKAARSFGLSAAECRDLAKLALQRNRLVHRYLDLKWQAILDFRKHRRLMRKFLKRALEAR